MRITATAWHEQNAQTYVLRPRGGDPSAVRFIHGREPARDVVIDVKDGWRSISADKWTGSNVAYWAAEDLGAPVENQVRDNGDFIFDLRWSVGDLASMNAALERYGVEIIAAVRPRNVKHSDSSDA